MSFSVYDISIIGSDAEGPGPQIQNPPINYKPHHQSWANFLYTVLGALGIWLDEETVKAHMLDVFQYYSDTKVILDCTELRCQTPNSLLLQSEVSSTYKSHCTFKGLIGMAPHGAVTFVSSLYEGIISDT